MNQTGAKQPKAEGNDSKVREIDPKLLDELRAYMKAQLITQNELGIRLGYTGTYASKALSGKFTGNVDKFELAAQSLLYGADKKRTIEKVLVHEHFMVAPMAAFLDTVMHTGDIGVVWSPAGCGKTCGIECWLANNPTAIYVKAGKSRAGWYRLRDAILKQLPNKRRQKAESWDEYLERVFAGSGRLLIIDNAHLLTGQARAWVAYDWHEETGCPVALVGNEEISGQWESNAQHQSRVGLAREVKPTSKAMESAKAMVKLHLPESADDEKLLKLSEQIVKGKGACRQLRKHLLLTKDLLQAGAYQDAAEAFRGAHTQLLNKVALTA